MKVRGESSQRPPAQLDKKELLLKSHEGKLKSGLVIYREDNAFPYSQGERKIGKASPTARGVVWYRTGGGIPVVVSIWFGKYLFQYKLAML